MNIIDIMNAIDAIKSLDMTQLSKRQDMLVELLADMVNSETSEGEGTELNTALECQDWWTTLKCLTTDAGFKMLGNGHFSAAYSHPLLPGKVIKVGFKKEDSGAAYVAFCRMHQGRVGIPTIHHVKRHAGCYTVVLDELYECDDYGNSTHETYLEMARDIIEYDSREHDSCDAFVETCKLIREFFQGIASFDMHSGNIMFDKYDNPVITDPVSFSTDRDREVPFSVEPEELLKEVEEVMHQRAIDRAVERHERHVNRKEFRKMRRERRKAKQRHQRNIAKIMIERRLKHHEEKRNEERAQDALGLRHWRNVWCHMPVQDFVKLEECVAAHVANLNHEAVVLGKPLHIDRYLDARFQG